MTSDLLRAEEIDAAEADSLFKLYPPYTGRGLYSHGKICAEAEPFYSTYRGYICTREKGHDGPHVAHESQKAFLSLWPKSMLGPIPPSKPKTQTAAEFWAEWSATRSVSMQPVSPETLAPEEGEGDLVSLVDVKI